MTAPPSSLDYHDFNFADTFLPNTPSETLRDAHLVVLIRQIVLSKPHSRAHQPESMFYHSE